MSEAEQEHAHKNPLYYTRRDNEVHGPFPLGQITRYILLGRIKPSDEISEDHQHWQLLSSRPELLPEVLSLDMSVEENRQKLAAAMRWADERRIHRSEQSGQGGGERREPEQEELLAYREIREKVLDHPAQKLRGNLFLFLTLAVVIGIVWVAIQFTPERAIIIANCSAAPAPGVVWSNCRLDGMELGGQDLSGAILHNASLRGIRAEAAILHDAELQFSNLDQARLSGADLHGAVLTGASLREADLSGANLAGADLSYADLTDANLQEANLEGVHLDQAHWVDGSLCANGSLGRCN